jgi:Skp family chaperone for outer membrane proteins
MKKLIFAFAITSMFAPVAFAQTPTPPPRTTAASAPAPGGSTGGASGAATGGTGAEGKLAYIDTGKFPTEINELKGRIESLNAEFDPKKKEVQAEEEALASLKDKINKQGATVSVQVRTQWVEEATDKEKALTRKKEDYNQMAQKRTSEVIMPVYDKVNRFFEGYCQQRGIVMVLEGNVAQQQGILLFAIQATNITDDFIKEYNKANPAPAGAAASTAPKKP